MVQENLKTVAAELEKQELQAQGGVSTPELYGKLLAIYLFENDLCNAKYLWLRIPQSVKDSSPELKAIWAVAKSAWLRDPAAKYTALNYQWSENVSPIMLAVTDQVRERARQLISRAYSSISVISLSALLGLSQADALTAAQQLGWEVDGSMVKPWPPEAPPSHLNTTQGELQRLTEFVSFLEN